MHSSVETAWLEYIKKSEGDIAYMYLDTKGLVTVGIGNLIDPVSLALSLPFQFKSNNSASVPAGRIATRAEIESEWKHIKNHPNRIQMARFGHKLCATETNLELTVAERRLLFDRKTRSNEIQLRQWFAQWDSWPADAQMAIFAMAWGLGAAFARNWPRFTAACNSLDFDAAAKESHVSSWRLERNQATLRLLSNAARVLNNPDHYVASKLYYPAVLGDAVVVV